MKKIPLDELEVKMQLINLETDLSLMTSEEILKAIEVNFNVSCDVDDIRLLRPDFTVSSIIDENIETYKDIL